MLGPLRASTDEEIRQPASSNACLPCIVQIQPQIRQPAGVESGWAGILPAPQVAGAEEGGKVINQTNNSNGILNLKEHGVGQIEFARLGTG